MKQSGVVFSQSDLSAGRLVEISGVLFTFRDQSIKKFVEFLKNGKEIPFDLNGSSLFFAAPTAGFNENRGSVGPTTSARMAEFFPFLLKNGVGALVGKGDLPQNAIDELISRRALYLQALGGIGAIYGSKTKSIDLLLFPELGPEAIYKIQVENFPVVISVDSNGNIFF